MAFDNLLAFIIATLRFRSDRDVGDENALGVDAGTKMREIRHRFFYSS